MSELFYRLRSTDVLAWPEALQMIAWQMPWKSLALAWDPETARISREDTCPDTAPTDLFPKLAVKSWQEGGRLRLIPEGLPLAAAVDARLATPTRQQQVALQAWNDADAPPCLHLFPWRDMSRISEARFAWSGGQISLKSLCVRNSVAFSADEFTQACALIAECIPVLDSFVAQFVIDETGSKRLLDVNPVLTQREIDTLWPLEAG
ncbi:MAG: hypothetical protein AAGA15_06275 [Pseudomonadota bacterium]